MHSAPTVSYPVGRPRFAGMLAAGLWIGGAAVTLFWMRESEAPGWRHVLAALALLASGAWALLSWLRSPRGEVQWDGASWRVPPASSTACFDVALDLQRVLLVRWTGTGATAHWLWLEHRRSPNRWLELRRAVYSRARPPALPPARPPVATP